MHTVDIEHRRERAPNRRARRALHARGIECDDFDLQVSHKRCATTVALAGNADTTSAGTGATTGAFTPAAGDLLVALCFTTGDADNGVTDSISSDVWERVHTTATSLATGQCSLWIRTIRATAVSMTVTSTVGGSSTGHALVVLNIAGVGAGNNGAIALRQAKFREVGTAGAHAATFDDTTLTTSAILGFAIHANANPAAVAPPTGFTEVIDDGYSSPTTGYEACYQASGFVGTAVTWNTSVNSSWTLIAEIDTRDTTDHPGYKVLGESASTSSTTSHAIANMRTRQDSQLIVVFTGSGTASAGSCDDNAADSGTYTIHETQTGIGTTDGLYLAVRDQVSDGHIITVTASFPSDAATGATIVVIEAWGCQTTGVTAIKQKAKATGNSAATPAAVFAASTLATNVSIGVVHVEGSTSRPTIPTNWLQTHSVSYGTPNTGAIGFGVGGEDDTDTFAGTTVTCASTAGGDWGMLVIELNQTDNAVTGEHASTLDDVTHDADGAQEFTGAAASTLDDVAHAAEGTIANPVDGSMSSTLDDVAHAATGEHIEVHGPAASTLDDVVHEAEGLHTEQATGEMASTLDDATQSASGDVLNPVAGEMASTLDDAAQSASGTVAIEGASAATLDELTHEAEGTIAIEGPAASQLDDVVHEAEGAQEITGAAASTLGDVTQTATGLVAPPVTGTMSSTLDDATQSAIGHPRIMGEDERSFCYPALARSIAGACIQVNADDRAKPRRRRRLHPRRNPGM